MALPASGAISFRDVNDELRYSSSRNITINDSDVRYIGGKSTGQISFSDLHGKSYWKFNTGSSYHTPLKISSNSKYWAIVKCDVRFYMNTPGRIQIFTDRRLMKNNGGTGSTTASGASSAGSFSVYVNGSRVGHFVHTKSQNRITAWVRLGDQVRIVLTERKNRGKALRIEFSGNLRIGNMTLHGTNTWRDYSASEFHSITNSMLSAR